MENDGTTRSIQTLLSIMRTLRTPNGGCPWDLEQSFQTIAPYTIEEAYEVADAIERSDLDDLKGELGDLLFQVVFHAQMAKEANAFEFDDVVEAICQKMIRRHPHVFGEEESRSAEEQTEAWEAQKAAERAAKSKSGDGDHSIMLDVPATFPALVRATKLQKRAAQVGFDWPDKSPVVAKIKEELAEVQEAISSGAAMDAVEEEIGDLLFAVTNLARHMKIDAEQALQSANRKFVRRFSYIERQLSAQNKKPSESNLEEMDKLWNKAKSAV